MNTTRRFPRSRSEAFAEDRYGSIEKPNGHIVGWGGAMRPRKRPRYTSWRVYLMRLRLWWACRGRVPF